MIRWNEQVYPYVIQVLQTQLQGFIDAKVQFASQSQQPVPHKYDPAYKISPTQVLENPLLKIRQLSLKPPPIFSIDAIQIDSTYSESTWRKYFASIFALFLPNLTIRDESYVSSKAISNENKNGSLLLNVTASVGAAFEDAITVTLSAQGNPLTPKTMLSSFSRSHLHIGESILPTYVPLQISVSKFFVKCTVSLSVTVFEEISNVYADVNNVVTFVMIAADGDSTKPAFIKWDEYRKFKSTTNSERWYKVLIRVHPTPTIELAFRSNLDGSASGVSFRNQVRTKFGEALAEHLKEFTNVLFPHSLVDQLLKDHIPIGETNTVAI